MFEALDREKSHLEKLDIKFPQLWGICLGAYASLIIYWLCSAASLGSPLGEIGDGILLLLAFLLVFFLSAGIMSLLLSGLIRLCRKFESRGLIFTHLAELLLMGKQKPWTFLWGLFVVVPLFLFMPGEGYLWLVPLAFGMLFGFLISFVLQRNGRQRLIPLGFLMLLTGGMFYFAFFYGVDSYLVEEATSFSTLPFLDVPDPGMAGENTYTTFTYGSGRDRQRSEYGQQVTFTTQSVDASMLWEGYSGLYGHIFNWYWGFSPTSLPVNGRVWLPEGEGPFPLVLVVHGNHAWNVNSDAGYAYLGEQLASRGYIVVSVDENFFNGSTFAPADGTEIPARAWLLLKHLDVWQEKNSDPQSFLFGKVDFGQIALVGHSNGGEAAAVAAYFNEQEYLPGKRSMQFDFNYAIQAVVQISPSDAVYTPQGGLVELQDMDYLLMQGAHDAQVMSFSGLGQYYRTTLSGAEDHFKAAVYLYRANHVYFNSAWGWRDYSGIAGWLINQKPLLRAKEQQNAAASLISAFLDASLKDVRDYQAWFADLRRGEDWLPEDINIGLYQDSSYVNLNDFQYGYITKMADLTSGEITCMGPMLCKEDEIELRFYHKPQFNRAVKLSWPENSGGEAAYVLSLPSSYSTPQDADFVFSLANISPDGSSQNLRLEFVDAAGQTAWISLSEIGPLHPGLETRLFRFSWLAKEGLFEEPEGFETMFQSYALPLEELGKINPQIDVENLHSIIFHADHEQAGQVWLDEIGFRSGF